MSKVQRPEQDALATSMRTTRVEGLDVARFVALVGMVVVNFDVVMVTAGDGVVSLASWLQGRAAATFVVLAGIGMGLGAKRKEWTQTFSVTIKRVVFLLILGLLNSLIFSGDIIHYYAFYFLFGMLFLRAHSWVLSAAIGGLIVGFVLMVLFLNYDTAWNWQTYEYADFWTVRGFIRNLVFNGWHPVVPWLAFLLFGVLLSRVKIQDRRVQLTLSVAGAVTFAAVSALSQWLMGVTATVDAEAAILFTTDPVPPMPLYMLAGGSAACITIGLCLLLEPILRSTKLLDYFTAPGRQSLSLYLAHIVLGMGILESLGMIGEQSSGTAFLASMVFCCLAIVYAVGWSRISHRGPVELVMRHLTG